MRTQTIGYDKLRAHYPSLFVSYCLDDGRAGKFFAHRYKDERAILDRARRAAEKGMEKGVLEALRRYHWDCGAPKEAVNALEKAGRGAAVVLTGQQPSLAFGPLYNFYKAQAALKLAQAIEARGVPCVAAFWNHSDDVRGGTSASFPDRENQVREVPIGAPEAGTPLYEVGSPEELKMFASAFSGALPRTDFSPWLEELLRGLHQRTLAESFSRAMLTLLGPFGLFVLEPRHLEGERAVRFFANHLGHPDRLAKAVDGGREAVIAEGFEDHLGRDVGLDLFEIRGARRVRMEAGQPPKGRASAGVALRPLLQDAVLPTAAYVGGPSEVGYQAALGPAYTAFGIDPPVIFPRVTATLIEPKIARVIEKYRLSAEDLFANEIALAPRFAGVEEVDVPGAIEQLPARWLAEIDALTEGVSSNPAVARAKEKTAGKVKEAVDALAGRLKEELGRTETTSRGQLRKLLTHVRPEGKLQERVFSPFYYSSLFGPDFTNKLLATLDPFVIQHQVITIQGT